MGRDVKVGLDYFPIYHDFFQNKKMKALRRAHGQNGLLTYLNILCRVYDNGYYYRFDSLEELSQDIAEDIAKEQLRKVAACVTETIHYLVEHQILDEELFKQNVISGVAMQEQYIKSAYRAKRKIKMDTFLLVDVLVVLDQIKKNAEEIGFSSEEKTISTEKSTQSKSKNKKEINNTLSKGAYAYTCEGFTPPTLAEVSAYISEQKLTVDAQLWYSFYSSNGWTVGGSPMYDWRASLRSWHLRGSRCDKPQKNSDGITEHSFDGDEFMKLAINRAVKQ